MTDLEFSNSYKIVLLGDPAVGKTAITHALIGKHKWEPLSIKHGISFTNFSYKLNEKEILLSFWDKVQVKSIDNSFTPKAVEMAACILLVYSIDKKTSFDNITFWLDIAHASSVNKILIGNKTDLYKKRVVSTAEGEKLANEFSLSYIEVSAKDKTSIEELFNLILEKIN